jgi:nucleoside-diphosphate-sugar epimerase
VTGATGFIGTAVVAELIANGHEVVGMTRSEQGARRLRELGATPHEGRLDDLESLKRGAAKADGVVHLAFIHDFNDASLPTRLGVLAKRLIGQSVVPNFMSATLQADRNAIDALGSSLVKTGGPLVITVGTLGLPQGRLVRETDEPDPSALGFPRSEGSETIARELAARGVRTTIVRLPPTVHGDGDGAFVRRLIEAARKREESAYIDDGENRWPAVHRLDARRTIPRRRRRGRADARDRIDDRTPARRSGRLDDARRSGEPLRLAGSDRGGR